MVPRILFSLLLTAGLQAAQAVDIYLYPARQYAVGVDSLENASGAVSRHLGLERFQRLSDASSPFTVAEDFVGTGVNDGILLTMNEVEANAVLSPEFKSASSTVHVPTPDHLDSLISVVSTYLSRAKHTYSSLFSGESWRLNDVDALSNFFDSANGPAFAALEVSKLEDLRHRYGSSSHEYQAFAAQLRRFLDSIVEERPNFSVAVMTFRPRALEPRKPDPEPQQSPFPSQPAPQEPIGGISTCFSDVDSCNNSTSSCSGRGNCVKASKAGRSCFVCACGITQSGEGNAISTESWAGERCERKDVSGPFVLLVGTTLVLLLVIIGSISLLYSVGDQSLPSILLATAVNSKRD